MAKTAKRQIGDQGEEVACKYLVGKGYRVLERNYLKPWGEIDIVAERPARAGGAKKLYFVEVKTVSRESASWQIHPERLVRGRYRPEENMHPAKLRRLHRAVQTYLMDRKVPESKEWQIDLACVYLDLATHKAKVEVLENVIL